MLGRRPVQGIAQEQIMAAATDVIRAEGLLAVTASRLARELRVAEKQLPPDVDSSAITAEAYRLLSIAELAQVRRTILANPSPVEQMRALLAWLSTPPEDSDAVRLEAWVLARSNPALRDAVHANEAGWHAVVSGVVRRGARSGDFLQSDADEVAAQVISLIDGINAYQIIGYRSDFDRTRLLTRLLQAELGLVWGPELAEALEPEQEP